MIFQLIMGEIKYQVVTVNPFILTFTERLEFRTTFKTFKTFKYFWTNYVKTDHKY